jgi:serine/threonine-protein kinase
MFPLAREAAARALQIDPLLADAWTSLAFVTAMYDWEWDEAKGFFERALELDPAYAPALGWKGYLLSVLGRPEEAASFHQRALDLDPLSPYYRSSVAWNRMATRRYDEAEARYREVIALDPEYTTPRVWLGLNLVMRGRYEDAVTELETARLLSGGNPLVLGQLGLAYALHGMRAEALQVLNDLAELSERRYVSPIDVALVHLGLGEDDLTFQWLERAFTERSTWLNLLGCLPIWDPLRADPRFQSLLRRINLSD